MFDQNKSLDIRRNFPIFDQYTFLNSASMAPLPLKTSNAMANLLGELTEQAYLNMESWDKTIAETRSLAARITGGSTEEMAFIRNTSDGVSLVASGLPLKAGDEVIINDLEFPSNVYPWLNLEKKGVIVKTVKSREGRVEIDSIVRELTLKTRIVAISTVQFSTGHRSDIARLGQLARERNFLLFVDAIQSLGLIPMDVKAMNVDFLSCGGHKWLCAPEGIGVFFCDKRNLDSLDIVRLGWNSVTDSRNFASIDFRLRPTAERFEEGSSNLVGIYGLRESLSLVMENGVENNFSHALALNDHLAERLLSKNYKILSPFGENERSGILVFSSSDRGDNTGLAKKLRDNGVLVIERGNGIRVSPHFFNTIDDIDKLIDTI